MTPRTPEVLNTQVTFQAHANHVVAVFNLPNLIRIGDFSISVRFTSPEQMLDFFAGLLKQAAVVWPDNKWVREYLSEQ